MLKVVPHNNLRVVYMNSLVVIQNYRAIIERLFSRL